MDTLEIIYSDKDYIFVNKPAGMLVHDVEGEKSKGVTVVDEVLRRFPEISSVGDNTVVRPGIVHRLDKETSGIMVVARNQNSFDYLKKLFQNSEVKKKYLALVYGEADKKGIIDKPISLKAGTTKRTVREGKMTKVAVTEYRLKKLLFDKSDPDNKYSLLEVYPKTGRTHQIRVHLASIGHPVVGDKLYGKKRENLGLNRQFLHAESIEFSSVAGRKIRMETELPKDLEVALCSLSEI